MILSGDDILAHRGHGLDITPFNLSQVNPNSYNVRLAPELLKCVSPVLDMKSPGDYGELTLPQNGLVLFPGRLYLGRTVERIKSRDFVPMIEGRSSVGRLGMAIHVTAGFGDLGFDGHFTLEISVLVPLIVYPDVQIAQVAFHAISNPGRRYEGKYAHDGSFPVPSRLHTEWVDGRWK